MKRIIPQHPHEEEFLEVKEKMLALLRDPQNLGPVRKFCQILKGMRYQENREHLHVVINAIAGEFFLEAALESEREREARLMEAKRERRARRLIVA